MKSLARRAADTAEKALRIRVLRERSAASWPEAEFQRLLFNKLQPDCVFDVGANIGQYASEIRNVENFAGTIISFEPNPRAFDKLERAAESDTAWHCLPYALGSEDSVQKLNVFESDTFASLLPIADAGSDHFHELVQVAETPQIEVRKLSGVYAELKAKYGFNRPFLKMDTQGFDLQVLAGAGECVSDFVGLVSEVAITAIYDGAPTIEESIATFRKAGLLPVGIFNVHAGDVLHDLLECNCYCARADLVTPYTAS